MVVHNGHFGQLGEAGREGMGSGSVSAYRQAPALVTTNPTHAVSPQPHVTPTCSMLGRAQGSALNSSSAPRPVSQTLETP